MGGQPTSESDPLGVDPPLRWRLLSSPPPPLPPASPSMPACSRTRLTVVGRVEGLTGSLADRDELRLRPATPGGSAAKLHRIPASILTLTCGRTTRVGCRQPMGNSRRATAGLSQDATVSSHCGPVALRRSPLQRLKADSPIRAQMGPQGAWRLSRSLGDELCGMKAISARTINMKMTIMHIMIVAIIMIIYILIIFARTIITTVIMITVILLYHIVDVFVICCPDFPKVTNSTGPMRHQ